MVENCIVEKEERKLTDFQEAQMRVTVSDLFCCLAKP